MTDAIGLLKHAWEAWDVRVMIVLSLFTQIVLFMLGNHRKYMVNSYIKILLWIAYASADWVAIAALGKLSSTCYEDAAPNNFLRGLWASALALHLGGPDTITAYSLEDNQLWTRHFLGLVVQATLAVYVIGLSWTRSWLSLLNFPLFLAGIIKYFERTWCLHRASSKNSREKPPLFEARFLENISTDKDDLTNAEKIVLAHQCSLGAKLLHGLLSVDIRSLVERTPFDCFGDIVRTELGFMFDMLYTKATIIYTKLGCILRLITFFCSLFVLVVMTGKLKALEQLQSTSVDIYITESLLAVTVALELYGLFLIVSSDWFVLVRMRYQEPKRNCLMRGILKSLDCLSWKAKKQKKKRWSNSMGQFNLLGYCMRFRKRKWISKILQKIGIEEMLWKQWETNFCAVPSLFLNQEELVPDRDVGAEGAYAIPPPFMKGERTLKRSLVYDGETVDILHDIVKDLDESIITWHILTDIFYSREASPSTISDERIITCKVISDYMMYLVVMKPHMIYLDKSIWFDSFSSKFREFLQGDDDDDNVTATTIYHKFEEEIQMRGDPEFMPVKMAYLLEFVLRDERVVRDEITGKWDILRSVWIEIMQYTAINCSHACHLQELRHGGELISFYWLLLNCAYHHILELSDEANESAFEFP